MDFFHQSHCPALSSIIECFFLLAKEKWNFLNGLRPSGNALFSLSILLPGLQMEIGVPLERNVDLLLHRQLVP